MYLSLPSALTARYLISYYSNIQREKLVLFNSIDMTVSSIFYGIFSKGSEPNPAALIGSRFVSIFTAAVVTGAYYGPIDPLIAISLNVASLFTGLFFRCFDGGFKNGFAGLI